MAVVGVRRREYYAEGVTVDSSENAYVTGNTPGALTGTNAGDRDIFLLKYDTNENLQ
jgi:hypothetical protein